MKTGIVIAVVFSGSVVTHKFADDIKPLTPAEAIKKVNEEVVVEMLVKATKNRLEKRGEIYLDSEENFRDPRNVGVVVTRTGAKKFKDRAIDDPALHFKGKTIQVKGTVVMKDQRPRIEVDEPDQIQLIGNLADDSSRIEAADFLFKGGKFLEAEKLYEKAAEGKANSHILVSLGKIALYSNRLNEAHKWLDQVIRVEPNSKVAKSLLAEVLGRQDDYVRAADLLRAVGQEAKAKQYESFKGRQPFLIEGKPARTSLKFVVTDPLPLVQVRVNGSKEVNFLIDTGAAQTVLDPDFAGEVGVEAFGSDTGTFAGGKQATVKHGRLDSIALGDFTIRNLPVAILKTRQLSRPVFRGKRVDGIIGTVLLYHFLSTLDYPGGKLNLEKSTPENVSRLEAEARVSKSIVIPFWMAGDHYMVAWGRVERSAPILLFVDTGLAGGGVTLAKSAIDEAGIQLRENEASEGIGGGGKVKVVPFEVKELALGDAREKNIRGLFTEVFPLENSLGFRLAGIISHGFFRTYALTFDFSGMRLFLRKAY
jgi:predicted aspartyl protease